MSTPPPAPAGRRGQVALAVRVLHSNGNHGCGTFDKLGLISMHVVSVSRGEWGDGVGQVGGQVGR